MMDAKNLIYGYIRALPELPVHAVGRIREEMSLFADREGFALTEVFIEHKWLQSAAWHALIAGCTKNDVRDIVVPDARHLHTINSLSGLAQRVLEDIIGGRVWLLRSDLSDLSVPYRPGFTP
jgi:hypothetical protein